MGRPGVALKPGTALPLGGKSTLVAKSETRRLSCERRRVKQKWRKKATLLEFAPVANRRPGVLILAKSPCMAKVNGAFCKKGASQRSYREQKGACEQKA